jgi:hypothetical protein
MKTYSEICEIYIALCQDVTSYRTLTEGQCFKFLQDIDVGEFKICHDHNNHIVIINLKDIYWDSDRLFIQSLLQYLVPAIVKVQVI